MRYVLVGLAGIVVGAMIFFGLTNFSFGPGEARITETAIRQKLESCSELVSTRYTYTNIGKFENSLELNGWQVPFTGKSFILTYSGEALIGTDLKEAKISIDAAGKTIHVELAPIEILSNSIDEKSFEIYDEKTNVFNPTTVSDYQAFVVAQKDKVEKDIKSKDIMETATADAEKAVAQIIALADDGWKVAVDIRQQ